MTEKVGWIITIGMAVLTSLSFFLGQTIVKPKVIEKIKVVKETIYECPGNLNEICNNLHKQEIYKSEAYYEGFKDGLKTGRR